MKKMIRIINYYHQNVFSQVNEIKKTCNNEKRKTMFIFKQKKNWPKQQQQHNQQPNVMRCDNLRLFFEAKSIFGKYSQQTKMVRFFFLSFFPKNFPKIISLFFLGQTILQNSK